MISKFFGDFRVQVALFILTIVGFYLGSLVMVWNTAYQTGVRDGFTICNKSVQYEFEHDGE